jgi:twitching motility protein PilT
MLRINGELTAWIIRRWRTTSSRSCSTKSRRSTKSRLFEETGDVDFGYEIPASPASAPISSPKKTASPPSSARFPARCFRSRTLKNSAPRCPPVLKKFAMLHKGLVVVTGPTGSGKSTTLAAMVDYANKNRRDHIITVEDPIEFVHESKSCLVNHREVGVHTKSLRQRLARRVARRPGHHPRRRIARPGNHRTRPHRRQHGPFGFRHPAHPERRQDGGSYY